jgi:mevalonate kinase
MKHENNFMTFVICDFGISKDTNISAAVTYAGTWRWMVRLIFVIYHEAPEVYKSYYKAIGQKQYDGFKADGKFFVFL